MPDQRREATAETQIAWAARQLQEHRYRQVPSVKTDSRLVPYWQRWEGPGGRMDWFEFPSELPLDLVWSVIAPHQGGR